MKKIAKRFISLLLCAFMLTALIPANAVQATGDTLATNQEFLDMGFLDNPDGFDSEANAMNLPYRDNSPLQSVRELYEGGTGAPFTVGKDATLQAAVANANGNAINGYSVQNQPGGASFNVPGSFAMSGYNWSCGAPSVLKTYEGDFDGDGRKNELAVVMNVVTEAWQNGNVVIPLGYGTILFVGSASDNTVPLTPVAFYSGKMDSNCDLLCADTNGDGVDEIVFIPDRGHELDTFYLATGSKGTDNWQNSNDWQGPVVTQFGAPYTPCYAICSNPYTVSDLIIGTNGVTFSMAAGDIDRDGCEDIVYIASSMDNGNDKTVGAYRSAYVLYGTRNVNTPVYTQLPLDLTSIKNLPEGKGSSDSDGQRAFARFGVTICDINGDANPEVMVAFEELGGIDKSSYLGRNYDIVRLDYTDRNTQFDAEKVYRSRQINHSGKAGEDNPSTTDAANKSALQIAWLSYDFGRSQGSDVKGKTILGKGSFIVNGDVNPYVITSDSQSDQNVYNVGTVNSNNKVVDEPAQNLFFTGSQYNGWQVKSFWYSIDNNIQFESIRSATINGTDDGFIVHYIQSGADYVRYFDLSPTKTGYTEMKDVSRSLKNDTLYYALPDIDYDSVYVHYVGHNLFWSDPRVVVALAAAPYFAGLPDSNWQYGSTSFGTANSTSTTNSKTVVNSAGAYLSMEWDIGTAFVKGVIQNEEDYQHTWTHETDKTVTYEFASGFTALAGQDSVVLATTAFDVYDYTLYAPAGDNPNGSSVTGADYTVVVPRDGGSQSKQLTYARYQQLRANDTNGILPDLSGVFTHTVGDPSTYPKGVPPLAENGGVVKDGSAMTGGDNASFPNSDNVRTLGYTYTTEKSSTLSEDNSISAKLGGGVKVGDDKSPVNYTVTAGVTYSHTWGTGMTRANSTGVNFEGAVAGQGDQFTSGFNWKLLTYTYTNNPTQDPDIETREFPVVTYIVNNVQYEKGHLPGSVTVLGQTPDPVSVVTASSQGGKEYASYTVVAPGIMADTPMELEGAPTGMTLETSSVNSEQQLISISINSSVKGGSYPLTLKVGTVESDTFYMNVDPGPMTLTVSNKNDASQTVVTQNRANTMVKADATAWKGTHQYFHWDNADYTGVIPGYSTTNPVLSFPMPSQNISLAADWHDHADTIQRVQTIAGGTGDNTITSATGITKANKGETVLLWADFGNGQSDSAYVPVDNDADYTASATWSIDGAGSADTKITSYGTILGSPYAVLQISADENANSLTVTVIPKGNNAGAQSYDLTVNQLPVVLSADPPYINLPDISAGGPAVAPQSSPITVTNQNTGSLSPSLTITNIQLEGDDFWWLSDGSNGDISSLNDQTINAGDTFTFNLGYSLTADMSQVGNHEGYVVVTVDGAGAGDTYNNQLIIPLSQNVLPPPPIPADRLMVDPASGDFGSTATGYASQTSQQFTVKYAAVPWTTNAADIRDLNDCAVTLNDGSAFEITALSTATMHLDYTDRENPADATATFSVKPKDGLPRGMYTDTVTFTSDDSMPITMNVQFTITGTADVTGVTVTPGSTTVKQGGTAYFSAAVAGTNNPDQNVTWTVEGGIAGTSISSSGVLIVAAGETATTLIVRATSVDDPSKSGTVNVTVTALSVPPTITTSTLLAGTVNSSYSQALAATGDGPITWSLASGSLPSGVTLGNDGTVSGTPTTGGVFTFTVKATNAAGSVTRTLSLTVSSAPVKTVAVGAQIGTVAAGTGGSVSYIVTTSNITSGSVITLNGAPSDVTLGTTATTGDSTTVTINVSAAVSANTYSLMLTIDGVTSSGFDLLVSSASDTTPPKLSDGTVNRTGDTTATISFTTDEAGTAYYLALPGGSAAPAATQVAAGASLGSVSGAITGKAVTLAAGAQDIYVVVEDAAGNVSDPLKITAAAFVLPWEATPNAAIDYTNETLTDLANGDYTVNGTSVTVTSGTYPIAASWFVTTISIVKKGDGITTDDSDEQTLAIPARPDTPSLGVTQCTTTANNDGSITNVTAAMEYSANGTTWMNCADTTMTGLTPGTYYVRVKATSGAFRSETATVTVGSYTATKETTPAVAINYTTEILTGFINGGVYTFNGDTAVTMTSTTYAIDSSWFGTTVIVVKKGDGITTVDSEPQNLDIPSRLGMPLPGKTDCTTAQNNDGSITNVTTAMEYSANGTTWTSCAGTTVTDLAAGTYYVRFTATDASFAGEQVSVIIGTGEDQTPVLRVSAPTFASVFTGYTQPSSQAITIINTGNSDATISSITLSDTSTFAVINGTDTSVPAGGSNSSWQIQPKAGLSANVYSATVTVTYDNGATATASVSFTVTNAPDTTSPTGIISLGTNNWNKFWNTVTFGLFARNTQDVTITGQDDSGTVAIAYYLSMTELTRTQAQALSASAWTDYSDTFAIQLGKYIVYAKLTDPSGNTTLINSDYVVVYQNSAAVTTAISFIKGGASDINASVTLNGNTVAKIMNGSAILTTGTDYTINGGVITFKADYLDSLAASAAPYTLTVYYNPQGVAYPLNPDPGSTAPVTTTISLTVDNSSVTTYSVTVIGSHAATTGSGNYAAGKVVTINAGSLSGYTFNGWTTPDGVTFANANRATTTFTMPAKNVSVTANWNYSGGGYIADNGSSSNTATTTKNSNVILNGSNLAVIGNAIVNSYGNGSISFKSTTSPTSTLSIPADLLASTYTDTKSADKPFVFAFVTPAGTVNIPANIISLIPGYNTLTAGKANVSIKVTVTDMSSSDTVGGALSPIVEFKLELVDGSGAVIAEITNFTGNIERIIPLNTSKHPKYYGVYTRKDSNSAWGFVPHSWGASASGANLKVAIQSNTNSEYVVVEYTPKFTDVASTAWYYDNVTLAAAKKLVNGMNDEGTVYSPENQVTRAEFIQMMANALRLPQANANTSAYGDVTSDKWYYTAIMQAKSAGLLTGLTSNGNFDPDQPMLREEMAYVLAKVAEYCKISVPNTVVDLKTRFTDSATIDSKYASYVTTVIKLGLMQGMSATTFEGQGTVTRAQAATVLVNMCKAFGFIDK